MNLSIALAEHRELNEGTLGLILEIKINVLRVGAVLDEYKSNFRALASRVTCGEQTLRLFSVRFSLAGESSST